MPNAKASEKNRWLLRWMLKKLDRRKSTQPSFSVVGGAPINDPQDFYGRSRQVQEFFACITGTEVLSVSILGAKRSGKTSFLKHVAHPTVLEKHLNRTRYLFVFIDLENGSIRTPDSFSGKAIKSILTGLENIPRVPELSYRSEESPLELDDLVCKLSESGLRIIFMLDEFECLLEGQFSVDFFSFLRSLVTHGNVGWVVTSFRPLSRLLSPFGLSTGSPFFNVFHIPPLYMGTLDDPTCHDLISKMFETHGMKLTEENALFLKDLAGGLPFWIQVAAGLYIKHSSEVDESSMLEQTVSADFALAMSPHFQDYWERFERGEKEALHELARFRGRRQDVLLKNRPYLLDLKRYGIVEKDVQDFRIASSALCRWIEKKSLD